MKIRDATYMRENTVDIIGVPCPQNILEKIERSISLNFNFEIG